MHALLEIMRILLPGSLLIHCALSLGIVAEDGIVLVDKLDVVLYLRSA